MSADGSGPWPCTTCRSDVNTGDKFCITCGASYNELQCPSCNAQLTVGFSCTQCGETLDWDQFFGIQQNAERPSPADQASGPGQMPPPRPVGAGKAWWASLNWLGKFLWISLFIIGISLGIIGIGMLVNFKYMVDFGFVFIQYGGIGIITVFIIIGIRIYLRRLFG